MLGWADNACVNILLVARVLAVIWIAVSVWMAGVNMFLLTLLLMGVRQSGSQPLSIRDELGIVLFFAISATVVGTWAFDAPEQIVRNVGEIVVVLAIFVLGLLVFRPFWSDH